MGQVSNSNALYRATVDSLAINDKQNRSACVTQQQQQHDMQTVPNRDARSIENL